ncbi:MAG TPA: hypothetical protein VIU34_13060 [Steroidobacter sp.]
MQRLFTMFPRGRPGIALLLLRASVVITLLADCLAHRAAPSIWIQAGSIPIAVALSLGFLTPIAATATLIVHILIWLLIDFSPWSIVIVATLDAVALALLGPGAYSIDAYRFGRRVLVLPPDPTL